MTAETAALVGAIIGALATIITGLVVVALGLALLKRQEFHRLQVDYLVKLFALRSAMHDEAAPETRRAYAMEANKVAVLFSSNRQVLDLWRDSVNKRTNDAWIKFIRAAAAEAGISTGALADVDVELIIKDR
ncbi:hypothetical protein [Brevundimonas sp. NIBR11]|uniref:hypothetical protein n=1 Tax=Brevundimonas sp. NIBR11 TaxID=3015999 RepID=UPI0022F0ADBD|nr:hypothetical protein [Brevundimonas sp. NIBR11]WGM31360.1 hypothetical protein KKHFBJBL_01604 [Brevundimonas sp. NIBR11]